MFERFTARARRALVIAQEEAREMSHSFLGTEHILLGVVAEADGVGAKVLAEMGVSAERCRAAIREVIGTGAEPAKGAPPFTPRAKKVLEGSLREALAMGHNYIGTEHLVLGLLREEGVAAQVLGDMGVELAAVRAKVLEHLKGLGVRTTGAPSSGTPAGQAVLEQAARRSRPDPVGSHHLLLGILDVPDSLGGRVLESFGLTLEAVEARIDEMGTKGTSDEVKRLGRKRAVKLAPGITLSVDEQAEEGAEADPAGGLGLSREELTRLIEILRSALERATDADADEGDGTGGGDAGEDGDEQPPDAEDDA